MYGCPHPGVPYLRHMRSCRWLAGPVLCISLTIAAQSDTTARVALSQALDALKEARRDGQRDTINAAIKHHLRSVLEQDDAFTTNLGVPPLSLLDAPDGKFRLLTWNIPYADGSNLFEGFLLVRDKHRHVLYELRDMTPRIENAAYKMLGPDYWYGALYYAVIPVRRGAKTWYTLLGWKGYSNVETRKVIDVLGFKGAVPQFGAPLFGEDRVKRTREIFGFSFQSSMSLKWEKEFNRIVVDHLAPMKPEFQGQAAFMGPDLSYDAYVWEKDHWSYQRDVDVRQQDMNRPWNRPPKE